MKIYTRHGDTGDTGLFDGRRVHKNNPRIETYGTIDELNSFLGLALAHCVHLSLGSLLQQIQGELFDLGADLATPHDAHNSLKIRRVASLQITQLESHIDRATALLPPLTRFILPGGSLTAAHLHVARTVCRRVERLAVSLAQLEPINPHIVEYLNRLSDLLFVLARWANQLDNHPDIEWQPPTPDQGASQ